MALIHRAQITPTKLELIAEWLVGQDWFAGVDTSDLVTLGAYRFDDPDGAVGIETLLVAAGDLVVQVPMTYRGAPLEGRELWLIGTMEHSVLGTRWVYDAVGDPVYVRALARMALAGGEQAEEYVDGDDGPVRRTPSVTVSGVVDPAYVSADVPPPSDASDTTVTTGGALTSISSSGWTLCVRRIVGEDAGDTSAAGVVEGTWSGQEQPRLLAWAQPA